MTAAPPMADPAAPGGDVDVPDSGNVAAQPAKYAAAAVPAFTSLKGGVGGPDSGTVEGKVAAELPKDLASSAAHPTAPGGSADHPDSGIPGKAGGTPVDINESAVAARTAPEHSVARNVLPRNMPCQATVLRALTTRPKTLRIRMREVSLTRLHPGVLEQT
jgi:hypothetical protein